MATVNAQIRSVGRGVLEVVWTPLLNGDVGTPFDATMFPDKTVTVRGTFGVGGSVTIKGTDLADPTAVTGWDALNDSRGEGNALTFTARDTRVILESPGELAPHVTAGDGTTSLTVVIYAQSTQR